MSVCLYCISCLVSIHQVSNEDEIQREQEQHRKQKGGGQQAGGAAAQADPNEYVYTYIVTHTNPIQRIQRERSGCRVLVVLSFWCLPWMIDDRCGLRLPAWL